MTKLPSVFILHSPTHTQNLGFPGEGCQFWVIFLNAENAKFRSGFRGGNGDWGDLTLDLLPFPCMLLLDQQLGVVSQMLCHIKELQNEQHICVVPLFFDKNNLLGLTFLLHILFRIAKKENDFLSLILQVATSTYIHKSYLRIFQFKIIRKVHKNQKKMHLILTMKRS